MRINLLYFSVQSRLISFLLLGCFFILPALSSTSQSATSNNLVRVVSNIQLTFDGGYNHPSFSPDGKKILYDKYNYNRGQVDIWIMDSNGKNRVQLTRSGAKEPIFSPDGKWIAFVSTRQKKYGIWIMSADCKIKRHLTTRITDQNPSWSPDGKKILYTTFSNGDYAIWQIDKNGGNKIQVSGNGEYSPSYSPDGKYIVYVKDLSIWKMKADGTGRKLLAEENEDREPSWSPDGKKIVFTMQKMEPICNVMVMNANGTCKQQLTTGWTGAKNPHFSSDGKQIVYVGKGNRLQDNIWIMTIK